MAGRLRYDNAPMESFWGSLKTELVLQLGVNPAQQVGSKRSETPLLAPSP